MQYQDIHKAHINVPFTHQNNAFLFKLETPIFLEIIKMVKNMYIQTFLKKILRTFKKIQQIQIPYN